MLRTQVLSPAVAAMLAVVAVAIGWVWFGGSAAMAVPASTSTPTASADCGTYGCHVGAELAGSDDPPTNGGPRVCNQVTVAADGTATSAPVACNDSFGNSWSNVHQCHAVAFSGSPEMSDGLVVFKNAGSSELDIPTGNWKYADHVNPDGSFDGLVMVCVDGTHDMWWASSAPGEVSPRWLAEHVVADMAIVAPQLGVTGLSSNPAAMEVVGSQTWMWIADPGESTSGPAKRSESSGSLTVSAVATVDKTVWDMGDGSTVTCAGSAAAGTAWVEGDGWTIRSPTCGYQYELFPLP